MKKLTILLALIIPLSLFSQNISVKSFKQVTEDMTARVTAPVKDQNGETCALIKIRTTQKGFVFEGDMLGIVKTVQKVAEIWVYVPAKAKKLTIKHQELGVLDNYLYPEPIKEATVYIMELTSAKVVTTIVEDEIKTAWIVIKTIPDGADVYINDTYMGISPFNKKMTAGNYNYRVEKSMYHNNAGKVEITGDEPKKELNITLLPAFGYAKISTIPENGASVLIDGEETDSLTPFTSKILKSGAHRLSIKKAMFQPAVKDFTIIDGQTTNLEITLIPSFGTVTINTSPETDIYIDAQKIGFGTYTGRVMEGFHSFVAKKDKYNEAKEQFEILAGKNETVNLTLQPKIGKLDIATTPMDATIKLNGKEYGNTPNTIKGLLIGEYKLLLEKKGYNIINQTVVINENKTTSLNLDFISIKAARTKAKADQQQKTEKAKQIVKTDNKNISYYKTKALKYKKRKNTFFAISLISAAMGGSLAYFTDTKYKEYQNATDNATDLHEQIESLDKIWKTEFAISAAALIPALIFKSKEKKANKNISFLPFPTKNGFGFNLVYKF